MSSDFSSDPFSRLQARAAEAEPPGETPMEVEYRGT